MRFPNALLPELADFAVWSPEINHPHAGTKFHRFTEEFHVPLLEFFDVAVKIVHFEPDMAQAVIILAQSAGGVVAHRLLILKQLEHRAAQFQMQGVGGFARGSLADQLGISEEQQQQIRDKARKLQQEMQKKMQEELLKELTPTQQAKLKELVGEPFVFEQEERQFPGPGGPPGGGFGGRRGRGN